MRLAPCGHFHHTPALGGLTGPITPGGRDFGPGQDRGLVTGDWFFRKQKIRNRAELTYVTPLDGAFTNPVASARWRRRRAHSCTADGRGRRTTRL